MIEMKYDLVMTHRCIDKKHDKDMRTSPIASDSYYVSYAQMLEKKSETLLSIHAEV